MAQQLAGCVTVISIPNLPASLGQCFAVEFGFGHIQKLVKKIPRKLRVTLYGQNPVGMAHQVIGAELTASQKLKTLSRLYHLVLVHCVEGNWA